MAATIRLSQQHSCSFDHLVGEREQHRRDFEAERVAKRRFHSSLPACLSLRARQVPQLAEECFGIFQRCCVRTLDEPPINRLQEGIGFQVFALVAPMLGEGGRGAQLPPTGLLLLSNRQRLGAVQPPPPLSGPASRGSCPADDGVPLQKTSRLFCLLFELPRLVNQGQPQTGRGWRGQRQNGPDKAYDDSRYWRARSLL